MHFNIIIHNFTRRFHTKRWVIQLFNVEHLKQNEVGKYNKSSKFDRIPLWLGQISPAIHQSKAWKWSNCCAENTAINSAIQSAATDSKWSSVQCVTEWFGGDNRASSQSNRIFAAFSGEFGQCQRHFQNVINFLTWLLRRQNKRFGAID